jgi:hypothetical protein
VFDRFSSIRDVLVRLCLGVFVLIVSACEPMPTATGNANPQIIPTCVSPTLSPYNTQGSQNANAISNMVTSIYSSYRNSPETYGSAMQVAFSQLGEIIMDRSAFRDVAIDGEPRLRISVTYLDPVLIQYVVLNYTLRSNNSINIDDFKKQIQEALNSVATRNEILFIITITAPTNDNTLKVNFPISNLMLTNASKSRIPPSHNDPILSEEVDVSKETIFGYVGYPVAISSQDCTAVMDTWTTSVTLDLKSTSEENYPFHNLFWVIDYRPLISLPIYSQATPTLDQIYDFNRLSDATAPPTLNWNDTNLQKYWEDMGRYIWNRLLMGSGQ